MASVEDTINNIKYEPNAVSNEELDEYIAKINKFSSEYNTPEQISKYSKSMSDIYSACCNNIRNTYKKMDEIFDNTKNLQKLKEKIKQFIDGTYECIKINMNNPDFDITLPIDTFSDENMQKLFECSFLIFLPIII